VKRAVTIVAAAFALGLAVVIGNRMSADAMAVVVGVVCGVLASVPTSLLLLWTLARRQGAGADAQARNGMAGPYPPVVVVNPGSSGYGVPGYGPSLPKMEHSLPPPGGPRSFRVVGDEETLLDAMQHVFPGLAEEETELRR
jgi:hypothetical protein